MTRFQIILKTFIFYWQKNLAVALGVAVSTAVLTGALVVGDSMQYSLQKSVDLRLGPISHTLTAGDRYFTQELASSLESQINRPVAGILMLEGSAAVNGGQKRLPKIQILGVDQQTDHFFGTPDIYGQLNDDEVIVSENLAKRLELNPDDLILFKIRKASLIPLNAPFVSDEDVTISLRLRVKAVSKDSDMGRFNLYNTQTAPLNAFISLPLLQQMMNLGPLVNHLLIAAPDLQNSEIFNPLEESWSLADLGLNLRENALTHEMEITSGRVFLDDPLAGALQEGFPDGKGILTYFVNSLEAHDRSVPYSFVTGSPDRGISDKEILVNTWLATDLGLLVGDSLKMSYFEVGPLRKLVVREQAFKVSAIQPIAGFYGDAGLAPDLPGLSDAGNCRDWDTGVPIDLEKIREVDEDYWDQFKGTPKAFISLEQARKLWQNRFGNLTAYRLPEGADNQQIIEEVLRKNFSLSQLGFEIRNVRDRGQEAAEKGVNFGELFLGLSFFVLIAGVILSHLLFKLTIRSRIEQIGILRSLGHSKGKIQGLLLSENAIMTLLGATIGIGFTLLYTQLLFAGLNGIWQEIIRTDLVYLKLETGTMLFGWFISILIGLTTVYLAIRNLLKRELVELRKFRKSVVPKWRLTGFRYLYWGSGLLGLGIPFYQLILSKSKDPGLFFLSGALLLLCGILGLNQWLQKQENRKIKDFTSWKLAGKNSTRNRTQSLSVVILLALGTFLVVSVGANRKNHFVGEQKRSDGTGGFAWFGETTVPILMDLNDPDARKEFNLNQDLRFVQFRLSDGDDASCLNLNAISQPRILGVQPNQLQNRFSFATKTDWLDTQDPWASLDRDFEGDLIPAIADQTVIQWSLLKEVGDTLWYTAADGREFGILLIGGLANSIFQGNLIISDRAFLEKFPSSSGTRVMLVESASASPDSLRSEVDMVFRDYGLELVSTRSRLAEFSSIENTYLSIFLLLGALGLLIGTIGLGLVLARSVQERRQEIALQRALGIPKKVITRGLFFEYAVLLALGILIGGVTALLAVFPGLISPGAQVHFASLALIIAALLANGFLWIGVFTQIALKNKHLAQTLKTE